MNVATYYSNGMPTDCFSFIRTATDAEEDASVGYPGETAKEATEEQELCCTGVDEEGCVRLGREGGCERVA